MTLAWRRSTVTISAVVICTALLVSAFIPKTGADKGFRLRHTAGPAAHLQVISVDRDSPAYAAGLRTGDVVTREAMSPLDNAWLFMPRPHERVELAVQRDTRMLRIVTQARPAPPPVSGLQYALADAMVVVYLLLGVLITFRTQTPEARAIAGYLLWVSVNSLAILLGLVAPTTALAECAAILQDTALVFFYYWIAVLACVFPPRRTFASLALDRIKLPLVLTIALFAAYHFLVQFFPIFTLYAGSVDIVQKAVWAPVIIAMAAGWITIVDGILHGEKRYRAQMLWISSAILAASVLECVRAGFYVFAPTVPPWVGSLEIVEAITPLGAAYAVLRNKVVDLQVVISRASIYGAVSVILIGLFIAVEWVAGKIAEAAFGHVSGRSSEITGLLIAMAVGVSARTIHGNVERVLDNAFFRTRRRNLEALRRFALEADVATDAVKLLAASYETLRRHVDSHYAAIYVCRDGVYRREHGSESETPDTIDENHPLLLRMRRFGEPFEAEHEGVFTHCMLFPMTVLGQTVGFIAVGPKHDRTDYLSDEVQALASLTHRVGIAYWLLRAPANTFAPV